MTSSRPLMDTKIVQSISHPTSSSATSSPLVAFPTSLFEMNKTKLTSETDADAPTKLTIGTKRSRVDHDLDTPTRRVTHTHPKHIPKHPSTPRPKIIVRRALTPSTSTVAFSSSPPRLSSPPPPSHLPTSPSDLEPKSLKPSNFNSRVRSQPKVKAKSTTSKTTQSESAAAARARAIEIGCEPVVLIPGETVIFGRHRHNHGPSTPTRDNQTSAESTSPAASLESVIPSSMHHLTTMSNTSRIIALPRAAQHASRVHAAVDLIPGTSTSYACRVVVIGQNGARVRPFIAPSHEPSLAATTNRAPKTTGKSVRLAKGTAAVFESSVEIDFYGAKMVVIVDTHKSELKVDAETEEDDGIQFSDHGHAMDASLDMDVDVDNQAQSEDDFPRNHSSHVLSPATSAMPPSSPPIHRASTVPSSPELEPFHDIVTATSTIPSLASSRPPLVETSAIDSPTSLDLSPAQRPVSIWTPAPKKKRLADREMSSPLSDLDVDAEVPEKCMLVWDDEKVEVKDEIENMKKVAKAASPLMQHSEKTENNQESTQAQVAESVPVQPCPADIDLAALLASTVVFSGSSKLSLPDLVKSLLESQPSLREHGDEGKWSIWAGVILETNPMFGKVERHGKDASGRPLLPHYYYNPDADPDLARAKELGGLVRPLRAAQRVGGKALDWRPVGSGRRRY